MQNKYTLMSDISKAVQSILVDTSEGKYILEEATVDEGEFRTVIRISVVPTSALKEDYLKAQKHIQEQYTIDAQTWIDHRQGRNLECGCPTAGTGKTGTPDYSIEAL